MAREYLMIVQEHAYGTPVTTPRMWDQTTAYGLSNYDGLYIRLDGGNAFTPRPRPTGITNVPYGGGFATRAYSVSDKQEVRGNLTTKLCVGQAPMLLSWAGITVD